VSVDWHTSSAGDAGLDAQRGVRSVRGEFRYRWRKTLRHRQPCGEREHTGASNIVAALTLPEGTSRFHASALEALNLVWSGAPHYAAAAADDESYSTRRSRRNYSAGEPNKRSAPIRMNLGASAEETAVPFGAHHLASVTATFHWASPPTHALTWGHLAPHGPLESQLFRVPQRENNRPAVGARGLLLRAGWNHHAGVDTIFGDTLSATLRSSQLTFDTPR
jgi:hypothetical protein